MAPINEAVAGGLFPGADVTSFHEVMAGPGRMLFQMVLMAFETFVTSAMAVSHNPDNLPLVAMRAFNERASDPINVGNIALQTTLQQMRSHP